MFRALCDVVIVRPDSATPRTRTCQKWDEEGRAIAYELEKGTVVAVGPGTWSQGSYEPVGVGLGDRVLFAPYDGEPIDYNGEVLFKMCGYEIVGVEE